MSKRSLLACTGFIGIGLFLAGVLAFSPAADARPKFWNGVKQSLGIPEAVCGNGKLESPEECDDGNTTSGDGCDSGCKTEFCGDGVVNNNGEECDDGNTDSGDGCSADCLIEQLEKCGDGVLDDGEECDDGNTTSGDGCSAECIVEKCGDGVVQDGEECDAPFAKSISQTRW